MITFYKKEKVNNFDDKLLLFKKFFNNNTIKSIYKNLNKKLVDSLCHQISEITGKYYKPKKEKKNGSIASIILEKAKINSIDSPLYLDIGDLVILGSEYRKKINFIPPKLSINIFEDEYFPEIYKFISERLSYCNKINKIIKNIESEKCIQDMLDLELLGKGNYGNVYKCFYENKSFALKFSKIKDKHLHYPYDQSFSSWHEVYFLNNIKKLIKKKLCPNLPILYTSLICDKCKLNFDDQTVETPSVISAIELGNGTLKDFLQTYRSIEELLSCLFQIMVAVYIIQSFLQMMNFDIKKENVLFYKIEPGGYWLYRIKDIEYYVPNYGYLFILNDFGISRTMSPKFIIYKNDTDKYFRLGSRYAAIINDKFVPINVENSDSKIITNNNKKSFGVEFKMDRESKKIKPNVILTGKVADKLSDLGISIRTGDLRFYLHPEIIPPFEFYNDTQDVIRMFIGGKRTTQQGNHKLYPTIPEVFVKMLKPYIGEGESHKDGIFKSPSHVLASSFIENFFSFYRHKPRDKNIIETFSISI